MSPILYYGVPSGCSFGSIVALEWSGLPYRLARVEMPEMIHTAAYRAINPVGETPALLTESGDALVESMAILNHIGANAVASGIAYRQGTREFDELNRMLAFLNTTFFNSFASLWHVLEHEVDEATKAALTEYGRGRVVRAHEELERMLGERPWLLGEHRTLADAYFVGIARWTKYHEVVDRRDYPNLQRLYDKLQADPAVVFAHAIEQQQPARSSGGFLGEVALDEAVRYKRAA
ncbi:MULTISPECIES: glutathione S-transferase family protein [unclassified Lysobacter]|uniref:glutathione S-transferase family protein n=1 Tax=unclassified Lysobacter TaxID=2635362 RepID=UPI001BE854DB|nr:MULTISPECIES: glutathione S-transferase family protein [unclassified Lysobacter]MBT2745562.1 glutathione S-transferase family protein [Lysobacter sp. ISL-42]MBT2753501.1 glutathione S-transferase family protein [Lysobacter sp. ISL-50]MBT2777115.1 glutathione S-transferase family protein [Lysobacter sp. ISL-54]MBT2780259.1 glutathione S-transferase family protein [Lysobacter sp. ISL-52]